MRLLIGQRADRCERVSAVRDEDAGEFTGDRGQVFTRNPTERLRLPLQEHLSGRLVLASLGVVIGDRLDGDPLAGLGLKELQLCFDPLAVLLLQSCVFQPLLKATDCRQSHSGSLRGRFAPVVRGQKAMLQPILAFRRLLITNANYAEAVYDSATFCTYPLFS